MQIKRRFKLTATCNECGYKITKEIASDLQEILSVSEKSIAQGSLLYSQAASGSYQL